MNRVTDSRSCRVPPVTRCSLRGAIQALTMFRPTPLVEGVPQFPALTHFSSRPA